MKAIGFTGRKGTDNPDSFIEFEQPVPIPTGKDILVKIKAVSVNPIDFKIRMATKEMQSPPKILGWDAAGIVEAVGEDTSLFKVGDKVFYAGDLTRSGSNATHQLVDERIVGFMPKTLDFTEAAALPLTSITTWEALFDRLKIDPKKDTGKTILLIGGAGGVGSIAIQIAKQIANLNVIATASRDATRQWCLSLGADHIINHREDMPAQFKQMDLAAPDYIFCLSNTDDHFPAMVDLIAPQGMICSIVEAKVNHDIDLLKLKSAGFVWELMFTRSMFQTVDMIRQHELLNEVAELIDSGSLRTTLNENLGYMTPENISKAHKQLESGTSIGKIVLEVD